MDCWAKRFCHLFINTIKFINILKLRKYFLIIQNENMRDNQISCNQNGDIRTSQKHDSMAKNNLNSLATTCKPGWPTVSQFVPGKLLQNNIIHQYTHLLVWKACT